MSRCPQWLYSRKLYQKKKWLFKKNQIWANAWSGEVWKEVDTEGLGWRENGHTNSTGMFGEASRVLIILCIPKIIHNIHTYQQIHWWYTYTHIHIHPSIHLSIHTHPHTHTHAYYTHYTFWADNAPHKRHRLSNKNHSNRHKKSSFELLVRVVQSDLSNKLWLSPLVACL